MAEAKMLSGIVLNKTTSTKNGQTMYVNWVKVDYFYDPEKDKLASPQEMADWTNFPFPSGQSQYDSIELGDRITSYYDTDTKKASRIEVTKTEQSGKIKPSMCLWFILPVLAWGVNFFVSNLS